MTLAFGKLRARLGIPHTEQRELELQHVPRRITRPTRPALSHPPEEVRRRRIAVEDLPDLRDRLFAPLVHHREQQLFFALEIRVERTARQPRARGNLFDRRAVEPAL